MGLSPSSVVRGFENTLASDDVAKALGMKEPALRVYRIVRLRCANGEPLLLETTFIPTHLLPGLTREDVERGSLYTLLAEQMQMKPEVAEETYETMVIDDKTAELLKCRPGIGGFFVERRTWNQTGELFELTQSVIRGDRTKFVLKLKNDSVSWDRSFIK
jgi:GntR family transcriptional regulator